MITKQRIDQFYEDVERLGLKFPVARIAKETGESKGNVSKYLNKKIEPSESFIQRFYEKFHISSKEVSRESDNTTIKLVGDKDSLSMQALVNLTESNKILAESNKSLARSHEELVAMVKDKSTAYAQEHIPVAVSASFAGVLEVIAEIGTKTKQWKSKEEGLAALHRFVPVPGPVISEENIHVGSDKVSNRR